MNVASFSSCKEKLFFKDEEQLLVASPLEVKREKESAPQYRAMEISLEYINAAETM